ncbi:hypothetical protein D8B26_001281 [Coccidioides posadasii str. Silveira]|uniref:C6 finger domain transcription factor nscR n=1 Tax=Coccidioides posadasii (strain C735) TaxID=222929 RepID=C5PEY0_COCP7|nr:Fungal specific transcription factor, putative [Coccidioides posadasii C735 delta SOWgp]EER23198.1 Fungal specific transcription factor, putative [Coccidioides posadasii C735 delta SOWgp]QVM06574.1 hypothetical protein D8B26_001281 [Coccidioides posadasii str. Silveira]|eukprot:XP_003065343.1 Fungal specific transcription factor, putative [Coccidioides posadasii C735 delta SOWgp]
MGSVASPTTLMLRRNGKPHSCEPCRISKVKCDHTTPICQRCESRGIVSKCYYHPAPLTKRVKPSPGSEDSQERPNKRKKPARRTKSPTVASAISPTNLECGLATDQSAYLGSTSFLSVFHDTVPQLSNIAIQPIPPELVRWQNRHLSLQSQLFRLLSAFDLYDRLIENYYDWGLFTIIPAPLILNSLRFTRRYMENEETSNPKQRNLYRRISQNTAKPLQLSTETTAEEFCHSFTGENLRWEFIGVIFAMAGLGAISGLTSPATNLAIRFDDGNELSRSSFAAQMVAASNDAIEISRQHEKLNDVMIWLEYTHCVLISMVLDERSHIVYRGFGTLISDMFAMGYHRHQPPGPGIPFFLSQTRKRIFAAAYRSDKNLATFLGRPPRIQHLYCDNTIPLDLDDETLMLNGEELNAAVEKLDADGWNPDKTQNGKFRSASVIRIRYMISAQREKILELSLGRKTDNSVEVLYKNYQECQNIWASIPIQFRYDANCWKTFRPVSCIAMLVIYLEYLHSLFHIQRILCQQNIAAASSLLNTSMQLLTTVLHLLKQPEQPTETQTNFSWIFLFYGLPAAGVLATELYQSTLSAVPWPSSTPPRSQIIRDLGMIISWFETAALPINPTTRVCVEITKVLSKLLDDALNYQPSGPQQQEEEQEHPQRRQESQLRLLDQVDRARSTSQANIASGTGAAPGDANERRDPTRAEGEQSRQQQVCDNPEQAQPLLAPEAPEIGIGIDDQFTSEKFLSWLDDLDWDATVPDLLF